MSSPISTRASRPLVLSALVLLAACGGSRAAVPSQELGSVAARTAPAAAAQPEAPALSCGTEANPCLIDEVLVVVSRGDSAKTLN